MRVSGKEVKAPALPAQGFFKVAVLVSVILSKAKNPILSAETLRFAQDDKK